MASLDQEAASKAAAGMLEKVKARATELWEKPLAEDPRVDKAIKGAIESYSTYLPLSPFGPFLYCSPARGVTWRRDGGEIPSSSQSGWRIILPLVRYRNHALPLFPQCVRSTALISLPPRSTGGRPT